MATPPVVSVLGWPWTLSRLYHESNIKAIQRMIYVPQPGNSDVDTDCDLPSSVTTRLLHTPDFGSVW